MVGKDEAFRNLGRDEVDVLNACVNANLKMNENEEVLNVCQAMEVLQERAAAKATDKTLEDAVRKLMKNLGLSVDKAMDTLEIPEEKRIELRRSL